MPLIEHHTNEFVTYKQELREAKDQYTHRKVQKDRIKHVGWFNACLSQKDIIITFKGAEQTQVVASKDGSGVSPLPEPPITIENVLGEDEEQIQHIVFYSQPDGKVHVVHIDDVICWTVTNSMMNQIDKVYKGKVRV
jgi:hypothetical protein|tara:strand:+ start:8249 stop:8659 length:411 start_codon:yes stop_codon:yes gene_type:complete